MADENKGNGVMTIAACRTLQGTCSSALHARLDKILGIVTENRIDNQVIKRHFGINGQYAVLPAPARPHHRTTDDPAEEHAARRADDVVIVQAGDGAAGKRSFRELAYANRTTILIVVLALLAGKVVWPIMERIGGAATDRVVSWLAPAPPRVTP
jgi:hypothetical protein